MSTGNSGRAKNVIPAGKAPGQLQRNAGENQPRAASAEGNPQSTKMQATKVEKTT
jgi:hypothetical protein